MGANFLHPVPPLIQESPQSQSQLRFLKEVSCMRVVLAGIPVPLYLLLMHDEPLRVHSTLVKKL